MAIRSETTAIADNLPIAVTTVNGKHFVSGLLWEKLDRLRGYMVEARQRGRQLGMDIVAIRQTSLAAQAGFAPHRAGASKGHYSMAVVLAERYGEDFVAAVEAEPDLYVFVAASEGIILPDSDLVLTRDEAIAKVGQRSAQISRVLHSSRGTGRELRIIAPAAFGIPGAEERSLAADLDPAFLKRHHQLKPLTFGLSPKERRNLSFAVIALAVLGGGGFVVWKRHRAAEVAKIQEQQRAAAREQALRAAGFAAAAPAAKVPTLPHPWLRQPPVATFLQACAPRLGKIPPMLSGWAFVHAECTFGNLELAYQRDPQGVASLDDFKEAFTRYFGLTPAMIESDGGNTVTTALGFATPDYTVGDAAPPAEQPSRWALISYFQSVGLRAQLTQQPKPKAAPDSGKAAPVQDWTTFDVAVEAKDLPPAVLLSGLQLPTVRVSSISESFNPLTTEQTWSVKGALYVAQ